MPRAPLLRVIGARLGLGALRDAILDFETVSRISVRFSGGSTMPASSSRESDPPFAGDPDAWIQEHDRVDRPGDAVFGWEALRRRAGARVPLTAISSPAFADGQTDIHCYATPNVWDPSTPPHVTCAAGNLVVDFDRLYPTRTIRHRPRHRRGPGRQYHRYHAGALLGACRRLPAFRPDAFPRDLLRDIFGSFREWTGDPAVAYDGIVEHPVLFVTREGEESRNLFHTTTDLLNAFETILVANDISRRDLEVVLLDNAPPGPLDSLWPRIFAPGRGVRRVGDFGGRRLLFRRALFSAPGYQSFLFAYLTGDNARPEPVGMLDAFSALVLRSHGIEPAAPRAAGPLRVTFISRRPYDTHEYMGRQLANEGACFDAVRAIEGVDAQLVDFARYPIEEQIRIAHRSDLLIGAHGAALTHLLWTPPHAGLLEIAATNGDGWQLFQNIARWTGRPRALVGGVERFTRAGSELTVAVDRLAGAAREIAAQVSTRGSLY